MTVYDIRKRMRTDARNKTVISLYRKGNGLLFKAPAKSPIFDYSQWDDAEVLDIDFSIPNCIDYDVEMELIIQ